MRFAYQGYLLLLLVLPFLVWQYWARRGKAPLVYSDISRIKKVFGVSGKRRPISHSMRHALFVLRLFILTLFILALARPQSELITSEVYTEGVDIIMTIDVSGSMRYIDLEDSKTKATRIDNTKDAVQRFINGRKNDRIGMTVFATDAFLQCPLTVDYGIVKSFLNDVLIGMVPENSTAIGNALASSVNRLRYSEAKSKVIILITDGANNAGQIDPFAAADMAKALGFKIYTIGVGGYGVPYLEVETIFGKQIQPVPDAERIDEDSMRKIAESTKGKYYRATDKAKFYQIFDEIDALEKTQIKSEGNRRFRELFHYLLIPALFLLLMEIILSNTRYRKLP